MSKRLLIGLAVVLGLGLSSAAQAVPSAFTGTFQITIEGTSSAAKAFAGTADVSLATGSFVLPAINTSPTPFGTTASGTGPAHPLFTSVNVWASLRAGGTFTPSGGPSGGFGGSIPVQLTSVWGWISTPPVSGVSARVSTMVIGSQGALATGVSSQWWLTTPTTTPTMTGVSTSFPVSASGWTANTFAFTVDGRSYTATGFDSRTATNRGGPIVLITPIRVDGVWLGGGLGGFATLTLDFAPVPEPGTALLLGSGLLGLVAFGRRRS